MKSLKTVFVLYCIVFTILQLFYFLDQPIPGFIRDYLADFLCMPIVLSICLFVVQLVKKDKSIRLNISTISSVFLMYSIYFEMILPPIHWRYTADYRDVLLYLAGSIIFYFLQKAP